MNQYPVVASDNCFIIMRAEQKNIGKNNDKDKDKDKYSNDNRYYSENYKSNEHHHTGNSYKKGSKATRET